MKKFNSVSIFILTGYIAVLIISIISAVIVGTKYANVKQRTNTFINETLPQITAIESVLSLTGELEIGAYSLYGLTIENNEFSKLVENAKSTITSMPLSKLEEKTTSEVYSKLNTFIDQLTSLQMIMSAGNVDWDEARSTLAKLSAQAAEIRQILADEKSAIKQLAEIRSSTIISSIDTAQQINWLMVGLMALVLFAAYKFSQNRIASPIRNLSNELERISESLDLSAQLPVERINEISQANQSVNHLLEQFKKAINNVSTTATNVQDSSHSLEQVTNNTEQAIEILGSKIELMTTQMFDLEQQITSSVTRSSSAAEAAIDGANQVESGMTEVRKTSDSIANLVSDIEQTGDMLIKLQASGAQVSTVVKSVAEIAEQTNLLALNAAIEAARAGESGRGFAVVADEVRTLANKTHQSTDEIDSMIATITSAIADTVRTMGTNQEKAQDSMTQASSTVSVLSTIRESILALSQVSNEVASSAQSVQQQMELLRQQVREFKDIGERVTSSGHETRSQAIELENNADQLGVVIGQFRL